MRKFLVSVSICLILAGVVFPLITSCSPASSTQNKTLKIGFLSWFGWPQGIQMGQGLDAVVKKINKNGGLAIGQDKYEIQIVKYDNGFDQATATAAANKLIYEDKVKFIINDPIQVEPVIPIAEANKVVYLATILNLPAVPKDSKYTFNATRCQSGTLALVGWFTKNYPNMKNILILSTDDKQGQITAGMFEMVLKAFGMKTQIELYPPNTQDLSSIGTKVKNINPDTFCALGASLQPWAAAWNAGYRGQQLAMIPMTVPDMLTQLTPQMIEGMMGIATATEFEPPATNTAKELIEAYTTANGKWDSPDLTPLTVFYALTAALQKAGSMDTDRVAEVLGNGLEFDVSEGTARMIARPDLGINRTVDCVMTNYIKKVNNGKAILFNKVGIDEANGYIQKILSAHP